MGTRPEQHEKGEPSINTNALSRLLGIQCYCRQPHPKPNLFRRTPCTFTESPCGRSKPLTHVAVTPCLRAAPPSSNHHPCSSIAPYTSETSHGSNPRVACPSRVQEPLHLLLAVTISPHGTTLHHHSPQLPPVPRLILSTEPPCRQPDFR
ncbi:hypothetical protein I3843_06G048400 [Carya illinoinensis]|nr:hypothetical protein I3843_06G048400 [Carya illinoinensis]